MVGGKWLSPMWDTSSVIQPFSFVHLQRSQSLPVTEYLTILSKRLLFCSWANQHLQSKHGAKHVRPKHINSLEESPAVTQHRVDMSKVWEQAGEGGRAADWGGAGAAVSGTPAWVFHCSGQDLTNTSKAEHKLLPKKQRSRGCSDWPVSSLQARDTNRLELRSRAIAAPTPKISSPEPAHWRWDWLGESNIWCAGTGPAYPSDSSSQHCSIHHVRSHSPCLGQKQFLLLCSCQAFEGGAVSTGNSSIWALQVKGVYAGS